MLAARLSRASIDLIDPKIRPLPRSLGSLQETVAAKRGGPLSPGPHRHPLWYCNAIVEATTAAADGPEDPVAFAKQYLKRSPRISKTPAGIGALEVEAYVAMSNLSPFFVETVVDNDRSFLIVFKGAVKESLLSKMSDALKHITFRTLVSYAARDYEEGIVSDLTVIEGVPGEKPKEQPKEQREANPPNREEVPDGFGPLPQQSGSGVAVTEEHEKPLRVESPRGLWKIYEAVVQRGPRSESAVVVDVTVPEGSFTFVAPPGFDPNLDAVSAEYEEAPLREVAEAAVLYEMLLKDGSEAALIDGTLEESFASCVINGDIDMDRSNGGYVFKDAALDSLILGMALGCPCDANPLRNVGLDLPKGHSLDWVRVPGVHDDHEAVFSKPSVPDESGPVAACENHVRVVAKKADAAEVDWAITKAGYVVQPFKSADGNVYWDFEAPTPDVKRRIDRAIRVLGNKAQFVDLTELAPEIDSVSKLAERVVALQEKDAEKEPEGDDHMEDPLCYRDDLQLYYDSQLLQGQSPHVAATATKRRFKVQALTVTPTGEVRSPGVVARPLDQKIKRPEDVSLDMEIEQVGRDAEQAELDKKIAAKEAGVPAPSGSGDDADGPIRSESIAAQ